jgi:hypothetical protein
LEGHSVFGGSGMAGIFMNDLGKTF